MNAKELLGKIKEKFDGIVNPAPVVAPVAASAPQVYKTQDGKELTVTQAGEAPAVGDAVVVDGQPAPDQEWCLEDGTCLTTVGGVIAMVTPPAPMTQPAAEPAPELDLAQRVTKCEGLLAELKAGFDEFVQKMSLQTEIKAAQDKADAAFAEVEKYKEIINDQFALIEKIAETPSAEPKTLTGQRKEQFERKQTEKEKRLEQFGETIAALRRKANPAAAQ